MFVGGDGGQVRVYSLSSPYDLSLSHDIPYGRVLCGRFCASYLAVGGEDDRIRAIRRSPSGSAELRSFAAFHRSFVSDIALLATGEHWVTCGWDGRVAFWAATWDDIGRPPVLAGQCQVLGPTRVLASAHAVLLVGGAAAAVYGAGPDSALFRYTVDRGRRQAGGEAAPKRRRRRVVQEEEDEEDM